MYVRRIKRSIELCGGFRKKGRGAEGVGNLRKDPACQPGNWSAMGNVIRASAIEAHTLSASVEQIERCGEEFQANMLIHVVSPKEVRLISTLDENRTRETLFISRAEVSEFGFGIWYDQERFMIELQANFLMNNDLAAVMQDGRKYR